MLAYLADADVSVLLIGEKAQYYGFKWFLQDSHAEIISRRTVDGAIIPIAGKRNLYPLPDERFFAPQSDVTPKPAADVIKETNADVNNKPKKRSRTTDETIAEVFATSSSSAPLWHENLGHTGKQKLKVVASTPEYNERGFILSEKQIDKVIKYIYEKVKNHKEMSECIDKLATDYLTENDNEFGLYVLFSFDYMYQTHICISEYLETNQISEDNMKLLRELVFNQSKI
jgi:hypothetical protein